MVVWGILTDLSIGHLFIAGVIPGFILAALMMAYIFAVTLIRPDLVGQGNGQGQSVPDDADAVAEHGSASTRPEPTSLDMTISLTGLLAIMIGALGGIWVGFFTPTEGAGIGALIALVVGIAKGMRWPAIYETVLLAARTAIPLMIIVFAAQLYSRTLAMSGIGLTLQGTITGSGLPEWGIVLFMIFIWLVLGTLIDSISIMLLTVPIFGPVALSLGIDPLVFAIVGILTIEAGLLTPPFGLIVYAVRSVIPTRERVHEGHLRGFDAVLRHSAGHHRHHLDGAGDGDIPDEADLRLRFAAATTAQPGVSRTTPTRVAK